MQNLMGPLSGRRILVVDDQPSILDILQEVLRDAGADVDVAVDGPGALRLLQTRLPDLILLDLAMPGMDGWRVLDALQASPQTAGIPVALETSAEDYQSF